MKNNKKISFKYLGLTFSLPSDALRDNRNGGKSIYINAKHAASLIKQYVKMKYPNIVCSASSQVYAGGSSVDANICNPNGTPVEHSIAKDVDTFGNSLRSGSFNGMIDMYEYREDEVCSDNGTKLEFYCSYIFVNNRPKFGTIEWVLGEVAKGDEPKKLLEYVSDSVKQKVINLLSPSYSF